MKKQKNKIKRTWKQINPFNYISYRTEALAELEQDRLLLEVLQGGFTTNYTK